MHRHTWLYLGAILTLAVAGLLLMSRGGDVKETPALVQGSAPAEVQPSHRVRDVNASVDNLNHLQVIVQDESGRAMNGAEVRSSIRPVRDASALTNHNGTFVTSAHGIAVVPWPGSKMQSLKITASRDGYAPRQMTWDLTTGDVIPANFTFRLTNGITLAGAVVDPEARPIPEATLTISRYWSGEDERPGKGEGSGFTTRKERTDKDGRWALNGVPGELLNRIHISVEHSGYLRTNVSLNGRIEAQAALRAGTHTFTMGRGLQVVGRVVNSSQQPVSGAQVSAGQRYSSDREQTRTDAQGRFAFHKVSEGSVPFTVMADGYAPFAKTYRIGATNSELVFQLSEGAIIRGIVQNEAGDPIPKARVSLNQGPEAQMAFSTETGNDGRFEWKGAPKESLLFYVSASGHEQKHGVRLKPDEENVVTLYAKREIHGLVLDGETGEPVKRFTVLAGEARSRRLTSYAPSDAKEFSAEDGRFTLQLRNENENAVEVTATGYAETLELLPKSEDRRVEVTIRLRPSRPLEGIVTSADGQPVAGVKLGIGQGDVARAITVSKGSLRPSGRGKVAVSDAAGRFALAPVPDEGLVIGVASNGFAIGTIAEVRANGRLVLQGFGRVEGVLLRGNEPVADQDLLINGTSSPGVHFSAIDYRTKTDAAGKFVFEDVPPGAVTLVRMVKDSSRSWIHSHKTELVVHSGKTTTLTLGGDDAVVTGRIAFEGAEPDTEYRLNAQLSMPLPAIPEGLTPEQRLEYFRSAEWREKTKDRKSFYAAVNRDGSLALDSIPPGEYILQVTATDAGSDGVLAQGQMPVAVPHGTAAGARIAVGELVLKPRQRK